MKLKFLLLITLIVAGLLNSVESQCGCYFCPCCCDNCGDCGVYTISTLATSTVTTTTMGANPVPPINRNPLPPINNANTITRPNRISMADYRKIQRILDSVINEVRFARSASTTRARRYNYDLSAQLEADSYQYRHGTRDELLDNDGDLVRYTTPRPAPSTSEVSIIGAINPQKLPGVPHIPPLRYLNDKREGEEEAPGEQAPKPQIIKQ